MPPASPAREAASWAGWTSAIAAGSIARPVDDDRDRHRRRPTSPEMHLDRDRRAPAAIAPTAPADQTEPTTPHPVEAPGVERPYTPLDADAVGVIEASIVASKAPITRNARARDGPRAREPERPSTEGRGRRAP